MATTFWISFSLLYQLPFLTSQVLTPGLQHVHVCKHDAVLADCDFKAKLGKKQKRKVYIYKKANTSQIQKDLDEFTKQFHNDQINNPEVEDNWNSLKKAVFDTLNQNVPSKILGGKTDLPWLTHKIQENDETSQKRV